MTASFRFSKTRLDGSFLAFLIYFCKRSSLRSQCWMRLFSVIFKHRDDVINSKLFVVLQTNCFMTFFFLKLSLFKKQFVTRRKKTEKGCQLENPLRSKLICCSVCTVFANQRKSLIQHCERSELRLHFEWTKVNYKCQKWSNLESFWKTEACGQTELPDRSVLIGQKLVENVKIQKFKWDILGDFQTLCSSCIKAGP